MIIDKDSIVIDNIKMAQYITQAKFGYHKGWAEDTGRNMNLEFVGSLAGLFPKVTLSFAKLTREEVELLAPILNKATQTVTYYDPELRRSNTIQTYSNDFEIVNKNMIYGSRKNEAFDMAFISRKKR